MLKLLREIHQLTGLSIRKKVCVAFTYRVAAAERILSKIPEHRRYIEEMENHILLSGSFEKEALPIEEGMTVLHTDSIMKAAEFMRGDPLIRDGLLRFELKLWEIRKGNFSITGRLSEGKFSFR